MRCLVLLGPPGSGKSEVLAATLRRVRGPWHAVGYRVGKVLIPGMFNPEAEFLTLGRYEGRRFDGGAKLRGALVEQVPALLEVLVAQRPNLTVAWEGAALHTEAVLEAAARYEPLYLELRVAENIRRARLAAADRLGTLRQYTLPWAGSMTVRLTTEASSFRLAATLATLIATPRAVAFKAAWAELAVAEGLAP